MKVGVIAVQGAVQEHIEMTNSAFERLGVNGRAVPVRREKDMEGIDCLIIPGGESTTISRLLRRFNLFDTIVERGKKGMPIMGTCAGCILLAKVGDEEVIKTGTELLGLMDMEVDRNAFGRQRESFEADIMVKGLDSLFHAVFIRAPAIKRVWGQCEVMATLEGNIVMAKQDNLLGLAFHPELSSDTRIHEMLIEMV
ncbi:MAG: pyridoxal 5'-phosphate synthase glutaminase subunit PdxT [Methanomassiliicoccales archaeon]|jgi:5'-phosphate synthase pdxT subunit|nr:pyridoxal 5'-phosphate synthase glutaminase subunit PdxT [Methanomassiliicoccales archaeon]